MVKLFHNLGAATAKAQSPLDLSLDVGTSKSNSLDSLSALADVRIWSSTKYWGARTSNILTTHIKILKSILKQTGGHCREARTGDVVVFFRAGHKVSSSIFH